MGRKKRLHPLLSPDAAQRGTALLDQQIWCWGCDIRRPEGNLMMQEGFTAIRMPQGEQGTHHYRKQIDAQTSVSLWGWGAVMGSGELGSIFISRRDFSVMWAAQAAIPDELWQKERLPPMLVPETADQQQRARKLVMRLCEWIAHYEDWILTDIGIAYRTQCITSWDRAKHPITPVEAVPEAWRSLIEQMT